MCSLSSYLLVREKQYLLPDIRLVFIIIIRKLWNGFRVVTVLGGAEKFLSLICPYIIVNSLACPSQVANRYKVETLSYAAHRRLANHWKLCLGRYHKKNSNKKIINYFLIFVSRGLVTIHFPIFCSETFSLEIKDDYPYV